MLAIYLQGFALSAAMILPLGPQNVFVMNQDPSPLSSDDRLAVCVERYHSDLRRYFGGSVLLSSSPMLLALVTWGGVAFLLWYGWGLSAPRLANIWNWLRRKR